MLTGSATKAAEMLGVSQSAVSQKLKIFESDCGLELFRRERGRLEATENAHILMLEVEKHFRGMELIEHKVKSLKNRIDTTIHLAAHPVFGQQVIPKVIAGFVQSSVTKVKFSINGSRDIYESVDSGEFDFGLVANEIYGNSCVFYSFCTVRGVLITPKNMLNIAKKSKSLSDMAGHNFVALNSEDTTRIALEKECRLKKINLNMVVETPYCHTVLELVKSGAGMGIVHPLTLAGIGSDVIDAFDIRENIYFGSNLIFRKDKTLKESAKELIKNLRIQTARELKDVAREHGIDIKAKQFDI
ncbi:LysR family transcriptional regulator (plasmid) [Candidatus Pantoea soli]|uniref:LysR family transcriptional regulator n=2 Tax=Candidatus Pantoea soli TaxID=3098669 RepID=A0A518XJ17_9GAMM|nr:LysR family transcriptional regulator [Pantoea soli]